MKGITIFTMIALIAFNQFCLGQVNDESKPNTAVIELLEESKNASEPIFLVVEEMPEFPGGETALYEFLGKNIIYPPKAKKEKTEGKVYVQFIINQKGKIDNIVVRRGVSPELDAAAIEAVRKMPDWIPGTQDGEPVSVQFTLPIFFSLK